MSHWHSQHVQHIQSLALLPSSHPSLAGGLLYRRKKVPSSLAYFSPSAVSNTSHPTLDLALDYTIKSGFPHRQCLPLHRPGLTTSVRPCQCHCWGYHHLPAASVNRTTTLRDWGFVVADRQWCLLCVAGAASVTISGRWRQRRLDGSGLIHCGLIYPLLATALLCRCSWHILGILKAVVTLY